MHWVNSPRVAGGLFFIAFIEAFIFPIPPDVLLIPILLVNRERWRFYALVTTVGSVAGALVGYLIGWGFYETVGRGIVEMYGLQDTMDWIGVKFSEHVFLTIFAAAFTPIPYKLVTIAAGLFKVSIWSVILASIVGRSIRYFTLAFLIKVFGKHISSFIYKYLNIISFVILALIVLLVIAYNFLY